MTQPDPTRYVFAFDKGDGKNKQLLGGKGANLCEMTQIGLNVPPGFVITTEACLRYLEGNSADLPPGLMAQIEDQLHALEARTRKGFGDPDNPLLLSVRSGSALSMPGMMDTVLNLGLNLDTLNGLVHQTGDERFGYDAYRRFIQLFGKVALAIDDEPFDQALKQIKAKVGAATDLDLDPGALRRVCDSFLQIVLQHTGKPFPSDPMEQLVIAVQAVFRSWLGKRAIDYRRQFGITPDMANGTAVNVMAMVFGNLGDDCATGVGFTRYPDTGENRLFGEYLVNAQGEDVVAGIRTPRPIDDLAADMPALYEDLIGLRDRLEEHYREVQDFEFTIERGRLYCLQTRHGKMNGRALVRTSVEMVNEGLLSRPEALCRVAPDALEQMLFPRLDPSHEEEPVARGLAASPGAASGIAVFDADRAEQLGRDGAAVILVREETRPEDIHGFFAAQGILTARGGKTSHAAVVARGMGKPCVAGAESILVDQEGRQARFGEWVLREGDAVTIDGTAGLVYRGVVPTIDAEYTQELETLLGWADEAARLEVRANADTPADAARAVQLGARGIGLCRTERMFNATERLPMVLDMILAEDQDSRAQALAKLLPIQRSDFLGMFQALKGRPMTVRLLDPPIHEFLPSAEQLAQELETLQHLRETLTGMKVLSETIDTLYRDARQHPQVDRLADPALLDEAIARKALMLRRVQDLHEVNPMLGHRGVRLGITFPEIYTMQIRALLEAAAAAIEQGIDVDPEVMVPQVCTRGELDRVAEMVHEVREALISERGIEVPCRFGSMLEVVRACLRAGSLASVSEFFSFGTNDLTQATFSFSREDAESKFLPLYREQEIVHDNPFEQLDAHGVGRLMELAVGWARAVRPAMKIGICGEHGGHPQSIALCHQIGLSYVSCSGPRVPVARLAAAQAALKAAPSIT